MFAERLKELRSMHKLTQQELADKLGITRSALSLYELGKREPDNETLSIFADFFEVSTDYLFGRTNQAKPSKPRDLPETVAPYLADGLRELTPEARKEVMDFIEYVRVKYAKKDGDDKK